MEIFRMTSLGDGFIWKGIFMDGLTLEKLLGVIEVIGILDSIGS